MNSILSRQVSLRDGTTYKLADLESNGISFIPSARHANGTINPMFAYAHLWGEKRQITLKSFGKQVNGWTLSKMVGIQIVTGPPTYKFVGTGRLHLTDLDIEHHLIDQYPETLKTIVEMYRNGVQGDPCEIETKSGGLRLSAFVDYCGSKISFTSRDTENASRMLFEIFSKHGLSRLDERYSQSAGSLLQIPVLPKSVLQEIYRATETVGTAKKVDRNSERIVVGTSQIRDLDIEWGSNNRSQLFPTAHCRATSHISNRNEVRFTRYASGAVDALCFNCGAWWWEVPPKKQGLRSRLDTGGIRQFRLDKQIGRPTL